jgi:hypothetical protein
VRVAHALTITPADARQWVRHLADYEVTPVLNQFPPAPYRLPPGQARETLIKVELAASTGYRILLRRARWRGYDPGAFRVDVGGGRFLKHFPGASLRAFIDVGDADDVSDATALTLAFSSAASGEGPWMAPRTVPLGEVSPIMLSECYADMLAIAGSSQGA